MHMVARAVTFVRGLGSRPGCRACRLVVGEMRPGDARGSASQGGQHPRRMRQGPTAPSGSRGDARIEAREGDACSGAGNVCPRAGTRSTHRRRRGPPMQVGTGRRRPPVRGAATNGARMIGPTAWKEEARGTCEDGRRPRRRAGELAQESGDARGAAAWEGRGDTERGLGLNLY